MPPIVSSRNDVWETSAEIPYWWRVTTQIWVVLLIGWSKIFFQSAAEVTRHQYGISALSFETPFREGASGGFTKSELFSQGTSHPYYLFNNFTSLGVFAPLTKKSKRIRRAKENDKKTARPATKSALLQDFQGRVGNNNNLHEETSISKRAFLVIILYSNLWEILLNNFELDDNSSAKLSPLYTRTFTLTSFLCQERFLFL